MNRNFQARGPHIQLKKGLYHLTMTIEQRHLSHYIDCPIIHPSKYIHCDPPKPINPPCPTPRCTHCQYIHCPNPGPFSAAVPNTLYTMNYWMNIYNSLIEDIYKLLNRMLTATPRNAYCHSQQQASYFESETTNFESTLQCGLPVNRFIQWNLYTLQIF